jgi:hypothetical protein
MGKHVEWRVLAEYPSFEINRLGDLRKIKTKERMDPGFIDRFYYGLRKGGESVIDAKRILIHKTFPEMR